ncbi:MAG: Gfo/Idh/MocA family oxidoreductase [Akkermansiaceae bacterium]|nr:Gfo/Idh/MocA family oxidoreductase [Akkermansiaceae bacterium]MDP4647089.1 Gfo/Idh/MocA family oxidoreductase [Akkermansiaceae bacterium]
MKSVIGAGLAVSLAKGQDEKAEPKKLGWALVGLSRLCENNIGPALLKTKHSRLAGLVTGTPEKAKAWQEKYGVEDSGVYNYENFDKILDNPDIDVVYIVLPNSMHKEFTLRAAKAGKHVYVEKPMAITPEDCREMIAACDEAGVKLGVAYRLQFEPHHMEAIRFAREKVFGDVKHIDAGFGFRMGGSNAWRQKKELGGGALLDVGVYAIQGIRYIYGEEPVTVCALETKTDKERFAEVDETITCTMKFASGKTANLFTTFNLGGYNRLTAFAEKGQFGMEPCFGTNGQAGWTSDPKVKLDFPKTDHFEVQMDLFSQAIIEGKEWKVDGTEGLRDHLVMEAILKSIASGKAEAVGKV